MAATKPRATLANTKVEALVTGVLVLGLGLVVGLVVGLAVGLVLVLGAVDEAVRVE